MTDTVPATGSAQLTGNVLFYSRPEPLSREQHGHLALKHMDRPFAFAATAHVVPLTVTEFAPAALSYPIIFAGDNKNPLAVMGVQAGENLFITPEGDVTPDAYLPAYVRRYPFVLADDSTQGRLIVCIERGAAMLAESGGDVPLFANGEATEYTQNAINFCNEFEVERRRTESFVELIKSLDLFETREANYVPRMPDGTNGEPQRVAEYFSISEEKLNALPQEKYLELRQNGALGPIYAQLLSTLGWDKLYARALQRRAAEAAAQPQAANLN
jgi:hypothetical protein